MEVEQNFICFVTCKKLTSINCQNLSYTFNFPELDTGCY